jgi:hypothetical protein
MIFVPCAGLMGSRAPSPTSSPVARYPNRSRRQHRLVRALFRATPGYARRGNRCSDPGQEVPRGTNRVAPANAGGRSTRGPRPTGSGPTTTRCRATTRRSARGYSAKQTGNPLDATKVTRRFKDACRAAGVTRSLPRPAPRLATRLAAEGQPLRAEENRDHLRALTNAYLSETHPAERDHFGWGREVAGSNPVAPTSGNHRKRGGSHDDPPSRGVPAPNR